MQANNRTPIEAKMQADYNAIAKAFSLSRQDLHWVEVDEQIASLPAGAKILDVGCGMGRLYDTASSHGLQYSGIDISEGQVEEGKRLHPQADLRVGSMLQLPYADASFDAVFIVASLHHLLTPEERAQAVAEAQRVLKPGGRAIVTVMALWQPKYWKLFWQPNHTAIKPLSWRDVFVAWHWKVEQPVYRYYHAFRRGELRALFGGQGWTVDSVRYVANGEVVPAYKAKNLVLVGRKIV